MRREPIIKPNLFAPPHALGIDIALEELEKNRGRRRKPLVVDDCLRLMREQGFRYKEQDFFT